MVRLEYDADGLPRYVGWALAGSSESAAAWAIARTVVAGSILGDSEWADGDDQLDNVWANRASLAYAPLAGGTLLPAVDLVPAGGRPGMVFATTALTPHNHELQLNGMRMKLVSASPGLNEYTVSGGVIVTGSVIAMDDYLVVRVWL